MGGRGNSMNANSSGGYRATNITKSQHTSKIQELDSDKYADGTYDIDTMAPVNYTSGFQVTFSQIGDNYSDSEYADKVNEFLDASSDRKTCAGKFEGTPEISFNVKDRNEAIKLAKKYNQISIWDWETCDQIETGGTGRR